MANLMDSYKAQYGAAASGYLYMLGGNTADIVAEVERKHAEPEAAIMREIQRLYFLPISRASALAVCNVLSELGELIPFPSLPDFRFNAWTFKDAWNDVHPDEAQIIVNGAAMLSI